MENGSYLGMLFIFSLTYDSLIIFLFEKKKTLLELNQFLSISQPLQSNNSSNFYSSGCKNAKANAFATVGLYSFLSPSLTTQNHTKQ